MFGLTQRVIDKINTVFMAYPEVEKVIIYGSRAKGTFREGSDIDLAMIGEHLNENLRSRIYWQLDDLDTPYLFDLSLLSSITNEKLIADIKRDGQPFYIKNKENE
ncbi:nucleotidyltransferase domain-containing protein [Conservatibacter flavescens]|nr:nucleotidyltransferase domain-containing protein [Conservatibacter flavescens]